MEGLAAGVYLVGEVVDLLVLLHADRVVLGWVGGGADEAQPVAVLGVGGVDVEEGRLAGAEDLKRVGGKG